MKKSIIFVSAVLVVVFISAFTLNNTTLKGYGIGDVADDFLLKNIDENMVSLADYKDAKGFIITFTCNTCPFAVMYEDRIQPGDALPEMKKRAEEKGFTFPYLLDEEQNVYPKFGATKTPHIFVLEKTKKGNVVKYIGAIDDNHKDASAVKVKFVENAVNALLKGEEVGLKETKAIGCSIKV